MERPAFSVGPRKKCGVHAIKTNILLRLLAKVSAQVSALPAEARFVPFANLCSVHWLRNYLWCGRRYIFACMVKSRIRRPASSRGIRSASDTGLSKDERELLPQLLQLLRSGALSSLLTAGLAAPAFFFNRKHRRSRKRSPCKNDQQLPPAEGDGCQ